MLKSLATVTALSLVLATPSYGQGDTSQQVSAEAGTATQVVGLVRAIEAAQQRVDGGVLEAELESEDGKLVYEVDLVQGETVQEVTVDARTGEVIAVREETLSGIWAGWFEQDELDAAHAARGTLSRALSAAEQKLGGPIREVSLDEEDGRWLYEIEVQGEAGERDVLLDVASGEVVRDRD